MVSFGPAAIATSLANAIEVDRVKGELHGLVRGQHCFPNCCYHRELGAAFFTSITDDTMAFNNEHGRHGGAGEGSAAGLCSEPCSTSMEPLLFLPRASFAALMTSIFARDV